MVCGCSETADTRIMTTHCYGMALSRETFESVKNGLLDFVNGRWLKLDCGPTITDVIPELMVGSRLNTTEGDFVVFGFYQNGHGHNGVRLIEVTDTAKPDPKMYSFIYMQSATWLMPYLPELEAKRKECNPSKGDRK